ncbi:hypothetical protein GUJ93_ZPchr0013g33825 [Zizania palustris]|uniref:Uncharacterized protein n=1 Tax=Zizania palustris TaxID=103762 RepID=A0A8J5X2S2_ZIZPA|nr:hypothetical protein GUJ93_ZPchr0013g33825 [Zizania palustris]
MDLGSGHLAGSGAGNPATDEGKNKGLWRREPDDKRGRCEGLEQGSPVAGSLRRVVEVLEDPSEVYKTD